MRHRSFERLLRILGLSGRSSAVRFGILTAFATYLACRTGPTVIVGARMPEDVGIGKLDLGSWACMQQADATLIRTRPYKGQWWPYVQRGPVLGHLIAIGPEGLAIAQDDIFEVVSVGLIPTWVVLVIATIIGAGLWKLGACFREAFKKAFPERERSADYCSSCSYCLFGLPDASVRCPECGTLRPLPRRNSMAKCGSSASG